MKVYCQKMTFEERKVYPISLYKPRKYGTKCLQVTCAAVYYTCFANRCLARCATRREANDVIERAAKCSSVLSLQVQSRDENRISLG